MSEKVEKEDKDKDSAQKVRYIGETSRSGYERLKEHLKDYSNLSTKSHILKHYLECHREIKMEEMKFKIRIIRRYRTAFERQIGESVTINKNLREGARLLNSKNEYNCCAIPKLTIEMTREELLEELEEEQIEKKLMKEIRKLKEKLRSTGKEPKEKRLKLEEVVQEMYRENYFDWYLEKRKKEKEREKEEERERQRIERLKKAAEKKRLLLEKITNKKEKKTLKSKSKEWIENKKEMWRKCRDKVEMDDDEEKMLFNKLIENLPVRKPRKEVKLQNKLLKISSKTIE